MASHETGREGPFPDSQQVYHQLKWDSRFSPDDCEIVLSDHTATDGTKVIGFHEFIPGGQIPWHRIIGFRYRGEVLWDRHARIDRRDEVITSANV